MVSSNTKIVQSVSSNTTTTSNASLKLVPGVAAKKMNLILILHMFYTLIPHIFVTLPLSILWHHVLNRRNSKVVNQIGRTAFSDYVVRLTRYILSRLTVAECRVLFNRTDSYDRIHASPLFSGFRDWVEFVFVNGTKGRWLAKPATKRCDDDIVLYFIHGGGFKIDSAASAQLFLLKLVQEMNLKRKIKFSVFCLDYELAPEFKYPSQLIEVSAGYHYLVNTLGVEEGKICISGDSAGGNLVTAFLLHLARPNSQITVPSSFGTVPKRPGSAFLISPFVKLVSNLSSRTENSEFDYIETEGCHNAALEYIGSTRNDKKIFVPSWNPLQLFRNPTPEDSIPRDIAGEFKILDGESNGLELLNSPYVNPSVCKDLKWWKEALPCSETTMITYGGKEIFRDDIIEFSEVVKSAGVDPIILEKKFGVHDWILYDSFIPGVYKTKSTGPEKNLRWGLLSLANFLEKAHVKSE